MIECVEDWSRGPPGRVESAIVGLAARIGNIASFIPFGKLFAQLSTVHRGSPPPPNTTGALFVLKGLCERSIELVELHRCAIAVSKSRCPFHLADDRVESAVRMLGRTEIA
jgi:hypothetical protein